ncbi:MAG: YraN family protein [Alphaproteobacteria bacterium]|nr:YraN family protein [Alphaproteobacteria bacterium]NNF24522.1 hypothetical protein [Paracoccaceae bacterium]
MSGLTSHLSGLCAEDAVAAHYTASGCKMLERRWNGPGGEIDLIAERAGTVVFIEVKRAKDFATAASRVSARQIARIFASASHYLARFPTGLDTDARFDVALVDGSGAVEIIENANMV